MEPLAVWASRVVGVLAVVYTLLAMWWSLVVVGVVVVGVVAMCRHVQRSHQSTLTSEGRVVLITGCDTGIGHEVAKTASDRGLTVVAGCLDEHSAGAERLAAMKRVHVLPLDVTDDDSVQAAVEYVTQLCGEKGLWAVVNNAGLNRQAPVELTSMMTFQHLADVMLFGTVRVTKAFLPLVRRAKGRIVTLSSDRGVLSPAHSAAYCITKHGIETFSDVLRAEMQRFDVRVCVMQVGHFGGATAIIDDHNLKAMQTSMERDLEQCSPEVQQAYGGQRAIQAILTETKASRDASPADVTPVVGAILHSLLSGDPADRYPVHGTTGIVDWGIVLGQVKPFIPAAIFPVIQAFLWRQ
ncbi:D-beta-hydroxybutyrate dehydrogenase, mitochondrial-like [Babylonia areolata]|uniref:D-beta-hydroxybutyrate dehydrogenase, mitochondrial-like n=1 Tax=Babylonia areolata TaxID=304850 RepID=UPI003FD6962C